MRRCIYIYIYIYIKRASRLHFIHLRVKDAMPCLVVVDSPGNVRAGACKCVFTHRVIIVVLLAPVTRANVRHRFSLAWWIGALVVGGRRGPKHGQRAQLREKHMSGMHVIYISKKVSSTIGAGVREGVGSILMAAARHQLLVPGSVINNNLHVFSAEKHGFNKKIEI